MQSYTPDYLYTPRDEELLSFVSFHIANALQRRQADESLRLAYAELEQRVEHRTSELADTNRELRDQISVRESVEDKLKHEALHDALTGLPNRSQLLITLMRSLARFRQDRDAGLRRAVPGPGPLQGRQRLGRPPGRRRAAEGSRARASANASANRTSSRAWAATNSPSCSTMCANPPTPCWSPSA